MIDGGGGEKARHRRRAPAASRSNTSEFYVSW